MDVPKQFENAMVKGVRERFPDATARQARSAVKWALRERMNDWRPILPSVENVVDAAVIPPERSDREYHAFYKRQRRKNAKYRQRERGQRLRRELRRVKAELSSRQDDSV